MDERAFQKLLLAEVESIHRLAYHLCRNLHESEDVVQETYLHALKAAGSFQLSEQGVRPWLFKILHNVLHTRRARDRRSRETLRRLTESKQMDGFATPASYPSNDIHESEEPQARNVGINWDATDQRLCQAIRLLPVAHRTVFLLAAVEDMKYREIAEVVGVPVGTVMSRLSRARTALAGQLAALAQERNMRARRPSAERQQTTMGQNER